MVERLLLTLAIVAVAGVGWWIYSRYQRRRATATHQARSVVEAPHVIYFRSDHCTSCATQARLFEGLDPGVRRLIEQIDVDREPERVEGYSVMTLPTTMVVRADGTVEHINYGVVKPQRLRQQLADVGVPA